MEWASWLNIVFIISTLILLGYYFFIWKRLANHKAKPSRFSTLPFASVVVCAKNEKENLQKFLPKVLNQKYSNFEVIVVDDQSNDGTSALLNQLSSKHSNLKPYRFNGEKISFGKKEVLEYGIAQASAEYIVMTDADCYPNSEFWLVGMMNGFADGSELVFGVGQYERNDSFLNKFIQVDTGFIAVNYLSYALSGIPYMSVGRNVAYKKELFERVGGFKNHYDVPSGDDDLFINEIPASTQVNIVTSPKAQTTSIPKSNFKSFFFQKTRHVTAGLKYNKRNIVVLGVYYSFTALWYLMVPILIYYSKDISLISTMAVLKKLTMYSLINRIFSKIGVRANLVMTLFADFLSVFVHNFAVFITMFKSKEGKW